LGRYSIGSVCVLAEVSTVAALFERGPRSVPSASCNKNGSSSLLSTQLVFAKNLLSGNVWMCARLYVLNKESDAFFLYSEQERSS